MKQEPNTTQTEIIKALGIVARINELENQVQKLEAKVFNQYTVKLPK